MEGERPVGNAHVVLFTVLQQFALILDLALLFGVTCVTLVCIYVHETLVTCLTKMMVHCLYFSIRKYV